MIITIHRGINQIGGCITEIASASGTKILIDLGHNLPDGDDSSEDKYDNSANLSALLDGVKAVFYTHPHGDHVGFETEVAKKGCYYMFKGCKNMKTAPKLLANTLGASAYCGMFWLCTSLTEAPELPAMNLGEGCYMSMFNICSSLVKAPELPATNLKHMCYETMFNKCTSLVKAQDILPAKELKSYCYREMFQNCTNLEKAPILPAEGFYPWGWCYTYMFKGCTKLNYIKAMFVSIPVGTKT